MIFFSFIKNEDLSNLTLIRNPFSVEISSERFEQLQRFAKDYQINVGLT